MAEKRPQTLENHGKLVFPFHMVAGLLALAYLIYALVGTIRSPGLDTGMNFALALSFFLVFFYARVFATQNQDRIIRLEEHVRMRELLPDDLQRRIGDFTTNQLIALRFASDGELPDLARKVLEEGIDDRKAIKQLIQHWRPDYQRV